MSIGKQIVHRLAVGLHDISGGEFERIFSAAIDGQQRNSPLGVADISKDRGAWSIKTVKADKPFATARVRLISGRNSPDFSQGIQNPHEDIQATGRAVLAIWNARVDEAMAEFNDLRVAVLIRNMATREFVLFEEDARRFSTEDYEWRENDNGNFEGLEKSTRAHRFTWQPHGSQFTIIRDVPGSARKFSIGPEVPALERDAVLAGVGYQDDWIKILE